MIKRALIVVALGVALTGGVVKAVHANSHAAAQASAVQLDLKVLGTGPQTDDPDTKAPCKTGTATQAETGDCENSPDTKGPETDGPDTGDTQDKPDAGDTQDNAGSASDPEGPGTD